MRWKLKEKIKRKKLVIRVSINDQITKNHLFLLSLEEN